MRFHYFLLQEHPGAEIATQEWAARALEILKTLVIQQAAITGAIAQLMGLYVPVAEAQQIAVRQEPKCLP